MLGASAMTAFLAVPILGCVFVFFLPLLSESLFFTC